MKFLMFDLIFEFLIFCDLLLMNVAVNKWELLNSCIIWGIFYSLVIKRSRGVARIRFRKVDRYFNLSNINIRKLLYYESYW